MKIGRKLLLHKSLKPEVEEDEFRAIQVVEVMDSVFKAIDKNGCKFFCERQEFNKNEPYNINARWHEKESGEVWWEITQTSRKCPFKPFFVDVYEFIQYCEKHGRLFYFEPSAAAAKKIGVSWCSDCFFEKIGKPGFRKERCKHWPGWLHQSGCKGAY